MAESGSDPESPEAGRGFAVTLQSALLAEWRQLAEPSELAHARILELGCGCGATTAQIAGYWPQSREVVGVDARRRDVDFAFAFVADERTDFRCADLEDAASLQRCWGGRFDWIFSAQALLWVREHAVALRNALWCLKPGGKCFLAVPASKPPDLHAAAAKVLTAECWRRHFEPIRDLVSDMAAQDCNRLWFHHPQADRVYAALLEQAGFRVLHTRLADFRYVFAGDAEYGGCLRRLMRRPLELVPEGRRGALLGQMRRAATRRAQKTAGGSVVWSLKYAFVVAQRPEL